MVLIVNGILYPLGNSDRHLADLACDTGLEGDVVKHSSCTGRRIPPIAASVCDSENAVR